jgi:hypothetical protein
MKAFEPQKNNRFLIEFGDPFTFPSYVVHKMSELNLHTIDGDGFMYWGDLKLSLYEAEQNATSTIIYKGIKERKSNRVLFKVRELNAVGDIVQTWEMRAKIYNISFGERDWSSDEIRKIEMHLVDVQVDDVN